MEQKKRPTFLTVICILTFIGSGFSFLSAGMSLINGRLTEDQLEENKLQLMEAYSEDQPELANTFILKTIEVQEIQNNNFITLTATNFIIALVSLLGAFMMFKLDKRGFGLYVLAQIAPIIITFTYFGNNIVTTISTIVMIFFSLLFIIMYAVNLKHMRQSQSS